MEVRVVVVPLIVLILAVLSQRNPSFTWISKHGIVLLTLLVLPVALPSNALHIDLPLRSCGVMHRPSRAVSVT